MTRYYLGMIDHSTAGYFFTPRSLTGQPLTPTFRNLKEDLSLKFLFLRASASDAASGPAHSNALELVPVKQRR